MHRINCFILAAVVCFAVSVSWDGRGFGADQVDAKQVVDAHVKSIGSPQALAAMKTLGFVGTTNVDFIQGMSGNMNGQSMLVSDGNKMAIVLKFGDINYPQEYFAYDGKEVSVGHISPGQRSPLADFLFKYNAIMKAGLLGGVLSEEWPLLDMDKKPADLVYHDAKIDGRPVHELEYRPKQSLREVKVKLYFDAQTYRHIKTEYRVRIRDDMSTGMGGLGARRGNFQSAGETSGFDTLREGTPDSIYVLVEKFDDFKKVGAMTLPHTYIMEYSAEGQGHTFIGKWTMKAAQWMFNRAFDEKIFIAQK